MLSQVVASGKRLQALRAGVRLFLGLHWQMLIQMLLCCKGFFTAVAGSWLGQTGLPCRQELADTEFGFGG